MAQSTQCTVTHIPRKRRYDITLSSPLGPWEDRRGERLRGGRKREGGRKGEEETTEQRERAKEKRETNRGQKKNTIAKYYEGTVFLFAVTVTLTWRHVLKTESSENNHCSRCNNPSYARSEKGSRWGNKLSSGFYYSHMTKNHSLSALTVHWNPVFASLIRHSTHTQTLFVYETTFLDIKMPVPQKTFSTKLLNNIPCIYVFAWIVLTEADGCGSLLEVGRLIRSFKIINMVWKHFW